MAFLSSLNIAGSGMTAQKRRLDTIAENIVNRETLRTEDGGPYRRKLTVFREIPHGQQNFTSAFQSARYGIARQGYSATGDGGTKGGVLVSNVIEDTSDLIPVYDPIHPDADEDGYIYMPNVDTTVEMVDAMAATRSFSANVAAFEAMKQITSLALGIGK